MDGRGCWRDNVFVERRWKSIKYEEVGLHAYETVSAARSGIGRYLAFYNSRRAPSALDGSTPDACYYRRLPALEATAQMAGRISTAPHALGLRMGRQAAPWITLHPQSPT
jgi:putative transposase